MAPSVERQYPSKYVLPAALAGTDSEYVLEGDGAIVQLTTFRASPEGLSFLLDILARTTVDLPQGFGFPSAEEAPDTGMRIWLECDGGNERSHIQSGGWSEVEDGVKRWRYHLWFRAEVSELRSNPTLHLRWGALTDGGASIHLNLSDVQDAASRARTLSA